MSSDPPASVDWVGNPEWSDEEKLLAALLMRHMRGLQRQEAAFRAEGYEDLEIEVPESFTPETVSEATFCGLRLVRASVEAPLLRPHFGFGGFQ